MPSARNRFAFFLVLCAAPACGGMDAGTPSNSISSALGDGEADVGIHPYFPSSIPPWQPQLFRAEFWNRGPATATGVEARLTLEGDLLALNAWGDPMTACSLLEFPPDPTVPVPMARYEVTCTTSRMDPGMVSSMNVEFTAGAAGTIRISGAVAATEPDPLPGSNTFVTTVTVVESTGADLVAMAYMPPAGPVGMLLVAELGMTNRGPTAAENVRMTATLSGPGQFVADPINPLGCAFTDLSMTCDLGTLWAWDGRWFPGYILATAEGEIQLALEVTSSTEDPDLSNNAMVARAWAYVAKFVDIAVEMTDHPDPAQFNRPLEYTILVSNRGPDDAAHVVLTDYLPDAVTISRISATSGSCAFDYGYSWCDLGNLAAGTSVTVTLVVIPQSGMVLFNNAWAWSEGSEIELDWANNSATTETFVRGPNPAVVTNDQIKTDYWSPVYVDCVPDYVIITGTLHSSYQAMVQMERGTAVVSWMGNSQGLGAQGLMTDNTWHATGMTRQSQRFRGGLATIKFVNTFQLISDGSAPNLRVHEVVHVVLEPTGEVRFIVDAHRVTCE